MADTPIWLNLCFMEKILRKSEDDDSIQVIDVFSKLATSEDIRNLSDIVRIIVEVSHQQDGRKIKENKSIIVKMSLECDSARQKIITGGNLFHNEISMMTDTLDKMNKLIGPKHRLNGKILYAQNENPPFLMIEDLVPLGFRIVNHLSGLDLLHSVLALRGLARFHAASVAVYEKEPKQKEMYSKGMFNNQHSPEMKAFFIRNTKALANEIRNWPEVKKYSEKIAKLSNHIYQIAIDVTKLCEDEFNVINHGDFHMNNMLFKYDTNGKPTDHIMIDFQMSVYASPANDIVYFFNSCPFSDVENKEDILLNEYLNTLSATMKQLNCKTKPPTMEELKAVLKRRVSFGMIISFTILPYTLYNLISCKETKDLNDTESVDSFPGLKNENYRKLMIKKLPLYDEWGLLDL